MYYLLTVLVAMVVSVLVVRKYQRKFEISYKAFKHIYEADNTIDNRVLATCAIPTEPVKILTGNVISCFPGSTWKEELRKIVGMMKIEPEEPNTFSVELKALGKNVDLTCKLGAMIRLYGKPCLSLTPKDKVKNIVIVPYKTGMVVRIPKHVLDRIKG